MIISLLIFISCKETSDEVDCDLSVLESVQEAYLDAFCAFANPSVNSCNNLVSKRRTFTYLAEDCSDIDLSSVIEIINSSECSEQ